MMMWSLWGGPWAARVYTARQGPSSDGLEGKTPLPNTGALGLCPALGSKISVLHVTGPTKENSADSPNLQ